MKQKITTVLVSVIVVALILALAWFLYPKQPQFCFDFVHDMQFGDREVKNPVNQGFMGNRGMMYFVTEVKALQTVLAKEGFYIDPLEKTGGEIYIGPFWGPTTHSAVLSFQKKYGLETTGVVDNTTIDELALKYGCPKVSTIETSTTTSGISPAEFKDK